MLPIHFKITRLALSRYTDQKETIYWKMRTANTLADLSSKNQKELSCSLDEQREQKLFFKH